MRYDKAPLLSDTTSPPFSRPSRRHFLGAATLTGLSAMCPPARADNATPPRGYSIPLIDLAGERQRQVIVDREPGQYLGHPTTVLLEDKRTIMTVYPKGHGKGPIILKRSTDSGRTWSRRLPTPQNWETSLETPTIHRVVDRHGKKRLIVFSGLYPIRMAVSEDDGAIWTELKPIGQYGGIVPMASVVRLKNGEYAAFFHDDGRFFTRDGQKSPFMTLYQIFSRDGGLSWSQPEKLHSSDQIHLCEPGVIRSPDKKQLAMLLRENRRVRNSHVMFSNDEARTWSAPRELPGALTGDRHTAQYAPDGRLFISFRDMALDTPTHGDWVAWVGRYDDIVRGREGQYRVRLMDNHVNASGWDGDCAYPGVEVLPDGTLVTTTYGHWIPGQMPFVISIRLKLAELDAKARKH
ncbi:MAG: sialidase family protein [Blastocatellia bacterium]